jgi:uncharacterized protein YdeI (YjbR/CyaY-like superfamily)
LSYTDHRSITADDMATNESKSGLPVKAFASAADWERWVAAQPHSSPGVWLKLAKKASRIASVSKQEAIDCALCHGWIDGQLEKYDDRYWLIRFTPRSAKSKWSDINRKRAQQLIEEGRMSAAGMQEVERAKADGRWEAAYPPQSKAEISGDLQTALDRNTQARLFFAELDSANRYAILYRLHQAKTPEARAAKIEQFVGMLARGEKLHPPRKRPPAEGGRQVRK